jgi:protein tyrosine phosphatase type IVA
MNEFHVHLSNLYFFRLYIFSSAPVLVAIALIQNGMDSVSAVTAIREKRRGAINAVQLAYLEDYQLQTAKKKCVIM